ncbi:MAG: SIS domain-containing protein [Acidimicrobiales bacterium]
MILDTVGMFDASAAFPEQLARALDVSLRALDGLALPAHDSIANIVLLGSGAAGQAGALVLEAVGPTIPVPIVVHRGYGVPNFVDSSSLVLAISFDGETAETLEAAQDAHDDGATVVCVSGGGQLHSWAQSHGLAHLPVMSDAPVERAALGSLSVPLLMVLERVGMYPGAETWIGSAIAQTTIRRDELIAEDNLARHLARRLGRAFPIIYGGNGPGGVAAQCWKTQFNQNAKVAAFCNQVPELTRDEIAGWGQDGDVTRQIFQAFLLRHDFEHPQVASRLDIVEEILVEVVGEVHCVVAAGEGLLAQLFDLELLGQFVSLHAAIEQEVDPGPVPIVAEIASRVGEA